MKNLSVIIITNNAKDKIERCLKSVTGLSEDIVVLDSNSTDGTFEICKKYTPNVFRQEWKGYAEHNYNLCVKRLTIPLQDLNSELKKLVNQ